MTDVYEAYALSLLRRMIEINTTNPPGQEAALAAMLVQELQGIGICAQLQPVAENRANVIARIPGKTKGSTLALTGHLDVVAAGEGWTSDPFCMGVRDGRVFGRGVCDMKGGIAAQITAVKKLIEQGATLQGDLLLAFVADEETNSLGLKQFLTAGGRADYAIIGEPTSLRLNTCHKGVTRLLVTVYGRGGHAARPYDSVNPIEKSLYVINGVQHVNQKLQKHVHALLGTASATVTMIHAGNKGNVIPSECVLKIDRRLLPGETAGQARKELIDAIEYAGKQDETFRYTVKTYLTTLPGEVDSESPLVTMATEVLESLTKSPCVPCAFDGCCEQTTWQQMGTDTIVLGPGNLLQAHTANEFLDVEQLRLAIDCYAMLVQRVLRNEPREKSLS
ncbi:MAG: M20 family metallopeptidase [Clostridia bacterium]